MLIISLVFAGRKLCANVGPLNTFILRLYSCNISDVSVKWLICSLPRLNNGIQDHAQAFVKKYTVRPFSKPSYTTKPPNPVDIYDGLGHFSCHGYYHYGVVVLSIETKPEKIAQVSWLSRERSQTLTIQQLVDTLYVWNWCTYMVYPSLIPPGVRWLVQVLQRRSS
jgi:hypothetical protein